MWRLLMDLLGRPDPRTPREAEAERRLAESERRIRQAEIDADNDRYKAEREVRGHAPEEMRRDG